MSDTRLTRRHPSVFSSTDNHEEIFRNAVTVAKKAFHNAVDEPTKEDQTPNRLRRHEIIKK